MGKLGAICNCQGTIHKPKGAKWQREPKGAKRARVGKPPKFKPYSTFLHCTIKSRKKQIKILTSKLCIMLEQMFDKYAQKAISQIVHDNETYVWAL